MRNLLITILAIIVGTLLLRVFIPWWAISLLMGTIAVLAIYAWTTTNTSIPAPWTKKILLIVTVIFAISLTMSFVGQKWPWIDKAFDDRQFYSSLVVTDLVDPKCADALARSIYQTERMRIRVEEKQLQALLSVTQQKLTDGIPLTITDEAIVKQAKERLVALDKELTSVNLARQKNEDRQPIGSWPWRLVAFGAILLAAVMFLPARFVLPGRKLIGFIGAMVFIAGLALVFFPEAQAKLTYDDKPTTTAPMAPSHAAPIAYSEPAAAPQLPANAKFVKTLAPGERIYLTRANMDAPPPERWAKFLDGQAAKFAPWPANARHRYAENTINENHDLYVVLPPGQNYTTSSTDPALGKQMAPAPMAPTAPTAHAKAYVNVIPAVPVSADPFRGKYTWDGREGYPGD